RRRELLGFVQLVRVEQYDDLALVVGGSVNPRIGEPCRLLRARVCVENRTPLGIVFDPVTYGHKSHNIVLPRGSPSILGNLREWPATRPVQPQMAHPFLWTPVLA